MFFVNSFSIVPILTFFIFFIKTRFNVFVLVIGLNVFTSMLSFVLYVAAVTCPSLVFREVSTTETVAGAVVNVSCPEGQKLTTGDKVMTTSCSNVGNWIPEVPECVGEINILQKLELINFVVDIRDICKNKHSVGCKAQLA